jgi:rubrerythrin
MNTPPIDLFLSRRLLLTGGSQLVLTASAVALLGSKDALAASKGGGTAGDVSILNVALGLEHEGINAYALGAKSGLLSADVTPVALKFQDDHKKHRDALEATIRKLGGSPVAEKSMAEYAKSLHAETLKNQTDVLELAARLELGATNAYLGVIPAFKDSALAKIAGRLAADEAAHFSLLNYVLKHPLPAALYFGA